MSDNRRLHERYDTCLSVDIESGENFLFSYITNISEMGIFIRSDNPLPIGTHLHLHFAAPEGGSFDLAGLVVWINPVNPIGENINPGMGVQFSELTANEREQVVELVRTIAYLNDDAHAD